MKNLNVIHVGSVSCDQIVQELNEAEMLAYPADAAIPYCEGFSVSVMEACAVDVYQLSVV